MGKNKRTDKAFNKIKPTHVKKSWRDQEFMAKYLNMINVILSKTTANTKLNGDT